MASCPPYIGCKFLLYVYMFVICVGVAYFTSALYVFFRDILQIVTIILQVIFWVTPIVWQVNIFDDKIQSFLSLTRCFIWYVVIEIH